MEKTGQQKESSPTPYELAKEEMKELVLRNSLLAVFRHSFFGTIDREFNQRERSYNIYSTQEETIGRMRETWKRVRKEEKEVIMFPARKTEK